MSKPEPGSGSSISALAEMPFEEALQKLESIVEAMESDDLPLETLLGKYEEGTKMSQICQAKMAEAELKIQQLEKNSKGELTVKAITFDSPAE